MVKIYRTPPNQKSWLRQCRARPSALDGSCIYASHTAFRMASFPSRRHSMQLQSFKVHTQSRFAAGCTVQPVVQPAVKCKHRVRPPYVSGIWQSIISSNTAICVSKLSTSLTILLLTLSAQHAGQVLGNGRGVRPSVRRFIRHAVCLSRRSTAATAYGGFAAKRPAGRRHRLTAGASVT